MSQLLSQTIPAASGMDVTSDPVIVSTLRAQLVVNCLFDRPGLLRSNVRLVNVLPMPLPITPGNPPTGGIDGVAWYYNAVIGNVPSGVSPPNTQNLLLLVVNGSLFYCTTTQDPTTEPFSAPIFVASFNIGNTYFPGGFFTGSRARGIEFNDELIFVQEGGVKPQRFFASPAHPGPHLYQCGIDAPPAATISASGTGLTGIYTEWVTYYDERGRESSPSPVSNTLNLTGGSANQGIQVTIAWNANFPRNGFDRQIVGAYVYRNTDGGFLGYRTANVVFGNKNPALPYTLTTGDYIYNNNAVDNAPDTTISAGAIRPNFGEFDPPNPATWGLVHKNRLVLNNAQNPNILQISVVNSPTQFTMVQAIPPLLTDGAQLNVDSDQGDPIVCGASLGSILLILKRRAAWFLYGDDTSDWLLRSIHKRGCLAPDSAVRCDNIVCYLSDDGVYAASYSGGEVVQKISKEIEAWLLMYPEAIREKAVGFFIANYYFLSVDQTIFAYSLETQGWGVFIFGQGTFQIGPTIPPIAITPPPFPVIYAPGGGPPPDSNSGPPLTNPSIPNPNAPPGSGPISPVPANPNTGPPGGGGGP